MGMKKLHLRLESLEKSLSATDKAREDIILGVLMRMSQENLDLLIDATVAAIRGRELAEREAAAKQDYNAALATECQLRRLTPEGRAPDVSQLIFHATLRRISEDDQALYCGALKDVIDGFELTAAQTAAVEVWHSTMEAQYQRAGFNSSAESEEWRDKQTLQRMELDSFTRPTISAVRLPPTNQ